jgi:hypothetical protein
VIQQRGVGRRNSAATLDPSTMKKLVIICAVLAAAYYIGVDRGIIPPKSSPTRAGTTRLADSPLARAIASRKSNVQVQGSGVVKRLLRDDNVGSRHQRFIIQLQ